MSGTCMIIENWTVCHMIKMHAKKIYLIGDNPIMTLDEDKYISHPLFNI